MGTDLLQTPRRFRCDGGVAGDMDVIYQDMIKVADLSQQEDPPFGFA